MKDAEQYVDALWNELENAAEIIEAYQKIVEAYKQREKLIRADIHQIKRRIIDMVTQPDSDFEKGFKEMNQTVARFQKLINEIGR